MHPYFITDSYNPKSHYLFPKHEEVGQYVEKMAGMAEEKTPPLIIYSEKSKLGLLRLHLAQAKQPVYVIPTEESDVRLAIEDLEESDLRDYLANLGVRRILIGGVFLGAHPDSLVDTGNVKLPQDFGFEDLRPFLNLSLIHISEPTRPY